MTANPHSLFGRSPALGADNLTLAEKQRNLTWWLNHPNLAQSERGQKRIAALRREIATLEAEASHPAAVNPAGK